MKLKLAPDLSLPLDAVSRTFGILAVRGAGKSNTAAVMAEEMFKAQLPFCVIDPVGSWYGLRSSSDGSAAGLAALGSFEPLPLGDALRQWLLTSDKLSTMEKALLARICEAYPAAIRKRDVLEQAGYASSGPVSSAFAKLVAYNYAVPQGASMLMAAEELFS